MDKTSNVPKLRFKEFTKPWEAQKLGEILTLIQSGLSRKLSQKDIGVPVLRSNNLINNELNLDDISYWYIKDSKGAKIENYFLKENDLLINFINSLSQIGKIALFKNELKRNTIFTTNLLRLNFNSKIYIDFMYFYFQTGKYNNYIQVITKPAVNQASFTTVDLKKFNLKVPSLHEQKKIANFLNSINHKIKLLNKKLGYFKDFKKYCFQNLFSEKLRFKNLQVEDNSDWKKFILKDILLSSSSNLSMADLEDNFGDYKLYGATGFIKCIDFFDQKEGYMAIVKDGAGVGKTFLCDPKSSVLSTLLYLTPKKDYNLKFCYYLLKTLHFGKYKVGSTIPHIYYKDFSKEKVFIPSVEEQEKIARFLTAIDKKIDFTQNQITEMEKFKKGLLQQMFV